MLFHCHARIFQSFYLLWVLFRFFLSLQNESILWHSVLWENISEEDCVDAVWIFMRVDFLVVEFPFCQCHQRWFINWFQKLEVLHNVLVGVQDRNTGLTSPKPVILLLACFVKIWSLTQCREMRSNGIAWHNDALVNVDWIVYLINQSDFGQQIMEKLRISSKRHRKVYAKVTCCNQVKTLIFLANMRCRTFVLWILSLAQCRD